VNTHSLLLSTLVSHVVDLYFHIPSLFNMWFSSFIHSGHIGLARCVQPHPKRKFFSLLEYKTETQSFSMITNNSCWFSLICLVRKVTKWIRLTMLLWELKSVEVWIVYYIILYSREWDTEKYTARYFPYSEDMEISSDISHIFTSENIFTCEDIDHVTFSIYTIFCLGLYNKQNITRWLEDMTFIFSC
jgi:hypothetical protein